MDGYTDSPFRRVCRSVNRTIIVVTEFTSTDGFHFAREKVAPRFRFEPEEQPIIAQIFGNNPANFIEAAQYCESLGFSGIDINMGCPAKHVVRSEQGVALRANPDQACRIVEAVAVSVAVPVSVKTRLGLKNADDLVAIGRRLANAGAALLTIHGRTYADPYGCPATFEPIYQLQRSVSIPVIGSGGISALDDGRAKLGNLAGFMIGQAALGNPWVFSEAGLPMPSERIALIRRHVAWMLQEKGARGLLELRKHLIAYTKGIPNAARFRMEFARSDSQSAIERTLEDFGAALEDEG